MDILYVILTALLVVAAVTMILKKVDTRLTFLFLGVIGLAAATIVTGQSVLGDSTTGNVWLDIFDVIRAKFDQHHFRHRYPPDDDRRLRHADEPHQSG